MMPEVLAVYEKGQLRLLEPLSLYEKQQVRVRIMPEQSVDDVDRAIHLLNRSGFLTPPSESLVGEVVSEDERRQLADALASVAERSLSEIVIEERG